MRFIFSLGFLLLFCSASLPAQERRISLEGTSFTVGDLFREVETQTDIRIRNRSIYLNRNEVVGDVTSPEMVREAVNQLLAGTSFIFDSSNAYNLITIERQGNNGKHVTEQVFVDVSTGRVVDIDAVFGQDVSLPERGVLIGDMFVGQILSGDAHTYHSRGLYTIITAVVDNREQRVIVDMSTGQLLSVERMVMRMEKIQHTQPHRSTGIILPARGIKTNLLYDATATINLGVEFRTGARTSLDIPLSYNPWTFGDRKWKHFLVQPEFRFWTRKTFSGHFFGLHAHYAYYNVSNLPKPFSPYMQEYRFQGWLAGGGVSYGHRWNFNHRWAMEATVGVGYAYLDYAKYECGRCGEFISSHAKNYFGPTKAGLSLIYGIGGRREAVPVPAPVPVPTVIVPVPVPTPVPTAATEVYHPTFTASFVTPTVEEIKVREEAGSLFLEFTSGSATITPSFRNNPSELQKIHSQLEAAIRDPHTDITGISLTGHASIEGTYASNLTLSERRATALKNHVRAIHSLPDRLFTVRGAGEDWATLDSLVAASNMPDKYRILEIIRGTAIFDGREKQLMDLSGGNPYRQMMAEFFPLSRRVDYTLHYTILPFTVEMAKEVFRTRPGNLSLEEMFQIARTYEPGSAESNEVFETAARLFPHSDIANLNAAAAALDRKEAVTAARYLSRVKEHNAVYWNNMGILQYLQDDKTGAKESFERSGAEGESNAEELKKHLAND
jgi:outer membrane protein OmpA-like peptidoglycan-associated protein